MSNSSCVLQAPAKDSGAQSSGTSPRPLSKVRTSFVTVERSGQMGVALKRENSGDPSMSKRRASFSIDEQEHPKETAERKESIATEFEARKNSTIVQDTIPESAIETPTSELDKRIGGPSLDQKRDTPKPAKIDSKVEQKKAASGSSNGHANGTTKPAAATSSGKPTTAKTISKPTAISTAKTTATTKASPKKAKTPIPKTPTTPVRSHLKEAPAKTPDKKPEKQPEKKTSRASLASSNIAKPASKPATAAAHGSAPKTRIPASPPQTGFVKPRPKSPTRPIKLPASLTAHTTSSGSKTATAAPPTSTRQSLSRASGNIQPNNSLQAHHAVSRSPSRGSTTARSTLTRKPSTLKPGHSRPSLGPPPAALKQETSRKSLPQQTAQADEGFLARMMRPTTSSASKTAEKPPPTPPTRSQSVKRPATKDGPPKAVVSNANPVAKVQKEVTPKAASKEVKSSGAASKAKSVKQEENSKAVESVPVAEDEITEVAKIPVKAAEAEISEAAEEPEKENEESKSIEPELSHATETVAPVLEEEATVEEEPLVVGENLAPVEDESVVAPLAGKVEAPTYPTDAEEEKHEGGAVEEPEIAKEEPEQIASPKAVDSELAEDPEDAKAREEIAKLNAEVLKAAAEDVE